MKYYARQVTHREPINRFGALGTPLYWEFFKTTSEDFLKEQNKGKRIKFTECDNPMIIHKLADLDPDTVYYEKVKR